MASVLLPRPVPTRLTVASRGFPDSSLPMFRLPTSSPTRPDKCNLSMRTTTKRQILEEDSILSSPSTTRIAVTSHESPGTSLPTKRHFRLPTDPATTPPGIRTSAIADVSVFTASESTPPTSASQRRCTDFSGIRPARQPQSIHYPGFDVFVDAARTVSLNALMDEAFDAQTTNISATGSDQDQEKENIDGNVGRSRTLVPRFITKRTAVYLLGVVRTGRRATGVVDQDMQTRKNGIHWRGQMPRCKFPKCLGTIAALIGDGGSDPKISGV
ncbi:hypothetical protein B0H13DRAFT_2302422 [Mycena leptocephala]|nr:hypothetical protein B0H13DRAFT_2302422 [Mycena leptocephala]